MNNCYIYKHITKNMPDGKAPYVYYGKGTGNRAWEKHKRHQFWKNVFKKYEYDIIILHENLTDDEAFKLEREIIAEARKNNENLVNLADGGKGMTSEYMKTLHTNTTYHETWSQSHKTAMKKLSQREEWREKNAIARKKLIEQNAYDHCKRKIILIDPNGQIQSIKGIDKFCKDNKLNRSNIYGVLSGKLHSHKGWTKYTPPEDIHNTFFDFK